MSTDGTVYWLGEADVWLVLFCECFSPPSPLLWLYSKRLYCELAKWCI